MSTAEPTTSTSAEWNALLAPFTTLADSTVSLLSNPDSPQLRYELYRHMFGQLSSGYLALAYADPAHPDFFPYLNWAFNAWAPNPDNIYNLAVLDGVGTYRLSGYRGTVRFVDFQVGRGLKLTPDANVMSNRLANFDLDSLNLGPDGQFEVVLSSVRPEGHMGDWWQLPATANYILVRQVAYDWVKEVDARIGIERLDITKAPARLTPQEVIDRLGSIQGWAADFTAGALKRVQSYRNEGLINALKINHAALMDGQAYIEGMFSLKPDEALIYEVMVPDPCFYWNVQLCDVLWQTIDPVNRQTDLNGHSAKVDADGMFRAVISSRDPGIANWLDIGDHEEGSIFARWQRCSTFPLPTMRKVAFKDVATHLPADTVRVTGRQRQERISERRLGLQLRRRW